MQTVAKQVAALQLVASVHCTVPLVAVEAAPVQDIGALPCS